MTLTLIGWLNGLTQSGLLIIACLLGLFFIYESKKSNAKLLLYLGLGTICIGLWQLAGCLDFITILLTGNNMPIIATDNAFRSLFWFFTSTIWIILGFSFLYYMSITLLIPNKKYYFLALNLVLSIALALYFIFDFLGNIVVVYPQNPGEDVINFSVIPGSPLYILMVCSLLLFFSFNVFGIFYRTIQSTGIIRKKFMYLSIGNLLFLILFTLDASFAVSEIKLLVRIGEIGSFIIIYFAIREVPERPVKKTAKPEVKVENGLFRLSKRPELITEEEVSISKEKKICLVCKGKVLRFSFICPHCEAFYCDKCAKVIMDVENACWACDGPLDESKPVKPYKKEEEIEIEKSKKAPKKSQKN